MFKRIIRKRKYINTIYWEEKSTYKRTTQFKRVWFKGQLYIKVLTPFSDLQTLFQV